MLTKRVRLIVILIICCICWGALGQCASPFLIDFPPKENLTHEDYIEVQNQLRAKNVDPIIEELYLPNTGLSTLDDFKNRCKQGLNQVMIDPEKGLFPEWHLEKIGTGSDMCFVGYTSLNKLYPTLLKSISPALRELGFNGYFLYQIGGFPNPSGKEISYAGVPYTFKIAMMLEAKKLGFNKVIWIDASMQPLRDPSPLFAQIEETGSLLPEYYNLEYDRQRIFPKTVELLREKSGVDFAQMRHRCAGVFGLKMNTEKTEKFIENFYNYVEMGNPFLSCFPEEFVISSIMGQSPKDWPSVSHFSIFRYQTSEDPSEVKKMKEEGVYFYVRKH
jgi:hypothetical protein